MCKSGYMTGEVISIDLHQQPVRAIVSDKLLRTVCSGARHLRLLEICTDAGVRDQRCTAGASYKCSMVLRTRGCICLGCSTCLAAFQSFSSSCGACMRHMEASISPSITAGHCRKIFCRVSITKDGDIFTKHVDI